MHNKVRTGRTHLPYFTISLLTHLVNPPPSERSFPLNSSTINFYQVSKNHLKKFFIPKLETAYLSRKKGWRKTRSFYKPNINPRIEGLFLGQIGNVIISSDSGI